MTSSNTRAERLSIHEDKEVRRSDAMAHLFRSLFVEFLGCTIFIFIGSMQGAAMAPEAKWVNATTTAPGRWQPVASTIPSHMGYGALYAALAHGITIAVLIMGMGHISGGHFNPAVTLGILISGKIEIISAAAYVAAQLFGGFIGSLLVRASLTDSKYGQIAGGATIVPGETLWASAITVEIIMAFFLVTTVLLTAVDTDSNLLAPLAIGLSISMDILAGGAISGASINPARSLGPCISASLFQSTVSVADIWARHYVFWVGPLLGAAIAGLVYKLFLAKDDSRILL